MFLTLSQFSQSLGAEVLLTRLDSHLSIEDSSVTQPVDPARARALKITFGDLASGVRRIPYRRSVLGPFLQDL